MHELSICESILETIEEEAQKQNFSSVKRICLEVGPFSGVEVEALRFGFDVVTKASIAEGALLDIVEPQAQAWCVTCSTAVAIENRYDACPICGTHQLEISAGEALRIRELEVN